MQAAERAFASIRWNGFGSCELFRDGIGAAVDVYHVWWDPKLEQQIKRAGKRILAYHICALAGADARSAQRPRHDGRRRDRPAAHTAPGFEAAGYAGFHEVEIFSELDWWQRDPDEVLARLQAAL